MTAFRRFFQDKGLAYFLTQYDTNQHFQDLKDKFSLETLLHLAVRFGSIALVNSLVELGVDVNAQDREGQTPLHRATIRSAEMVKLLLEKGANFNVLNGNNVTPLQRALLSGSIETVCLLLSKMYNLEINSNQKEEIPSSDFEKCREVVKICQDLNIHLNWKMYPILLNFIGLHGDEEFFKLVLSRSRNFNINAKSPDNHTLLQVLVSVGRENLVKIVLEYGARVNEIGDFRYTALHYAIMRNSSYIVRLLLFYGADVHHRVHEGTSPLLIALRFGSKEIVEMLLDAGVDVNMVLSSENTPLHEACGKSTFFRKYHIPEFTLECDVGNDWHGTSLEIIKLLIRRRADIQAKNYDSGTTPLLQACQAGRFDVVKLLLDVGANLHPEHSEEYGALHHAVVGNNIELVCFLLGKDFNIDERDAECLGHTPLRHIFEERKSDNSYTDMIEFLVDNGADVNDLNVEDDTIIINAICQGEPEEVLCLLELKATVRLPIGDESQSPYSSWCTSFEETDSMALRQFTAFLATKEDDISLYRKIEADDDDEKVFQVAESFFQKCKLEIEKMKSRKICDERKVSFFDFLTKELLDVVPFTSSEKLMQVLKSGEYKKEFPCYAFMLEQRIERVKKLRSYVDMIKNFLQKEYANINLPLVVLGTIFSYWSVGDVRNFGRALSVKKV